MYAIKKPWVCNLKSVQNSVSYKEISPYEVLS